MTQTELTREKQGLVPCQVLLSHWGSNTCLVVMQKKGARPLWKEAGLGPQVGVRSVGAAGQMLLLKVEMTLPWCEQGDLLSPASFSFFFCSPKVWKQLGKGCNKKHCSSGLIAYFWNALSWLHVFPCPPFHLHGHPLGSKRQSFGQSPPTFRPQVL